MPLTKKSFSGLIAVNFISQALKKVSDLKNQIGY